MRPAGLVWRVFLSILAVSLAAILATGIIARSALSSAFQAYLGAATTHMGGAAGGGMGRLFLGVAEQSFLAGVDRGILLSAVIAVGLAAVGALLLAGYLTRPLRRLTEAVNALAKGELGHRVEAKGPEEVEELARAFNEMAASLEEAETLRRRLVSDVAHELRNPIAAIRAQAEGVAEGVIPLTAERMESIVDDVGHLSRLVGDLQELSVAEAGRMRYEPERFDLSEFVEREADRTQVFVPAGVRLAVSGPRGPVEVNADGFRIGQVLRNLLMNAVRHTRHGSIRVAVTAEGDAAIVMVTDTGEGIPSSDLPYIFERFYRADAARATATGGSGLGLAIAKRIIEDHGGSVFATSVVGEGSTIGFRLPLAERAVDA
jgi:two-component system sensor histidine kinase BaeS